MTPTGRRSGPSSVEPTQVVGAAGASIGGLLVHNLVEFPPTVLLAPETLLPAVVTLLLGGALYWRPSRLVFLATAGWAVIVMVIGGASVFPLPIWPFAPEQTGSHYAAHAVYALAQMPLLWVAWRGLRAGSRAD